MTKETKAIFIILGENVLLEVLVLAPNLVSYRLKVAIDSRNDIELKMCPTIAVRRKGDVGAVR